MGKDETNGMDSRSWTFTEKRQWMEHWEVGQFGKLETHDEHGKVGQFKEVVWTV
jgi:hypothetical protein